MRNKVILSSALLLVTLFVFASLLQNKTTKKPIDTEVAGEGIQFIEGDWTKALAAAKSEKKLIFLDAYASWCGPCKMLKRKTFPNKAAGEFFNKNFINVAIDMEKGDGPALAEKYRVSAYPTLIVTDADGNIITYTQGYIDPKQLIDFGQHGLSQNKK